MAEKIPDLLDKLAPEMRKAFLESIADITSEAQIAMIVGALERGDVEAAIGALHIKAEMFQPLDDALRGAYMTGGREALAGLPTITDPFPGRGWWFALAALARAQRSG